MKVLCMTPHIEAATNRVKSSFLIAIALLFEGDLSIDILLLF